jgi:mRNA interferase MazF
MIGQKSIILVPFPYSDQIGKKVRPALVLSNPKFNQNEDVIICAITSNIKERHYSLIINSKNTINKKLQDTSQIRLDTITRIKKNLLIKEIDILDEDTFERALEILDSIFE